MYVNSVGNLKVEKKKVKSVKEFKYLGLILSNSSSKPEALLQARINKANSVFYAIRSNCRLLGISNVRVKLQLVNALVASVLQYGCVVYACLSNVESALEHTNLVFSKAEILFRRMLRWALNFNMDKRSSFLYVISN